MALVPADISTAPPAFIASTQQEIAHGPGLSAQFQRVRAFSHEICKPLAVEDFVVQTMPTMSPTKWHLLHTTWFFETFLLKPYVANYKPYNPQFEYLFNSYYNAVGPQFPRPARGQLSRPTVAETFAYREYVNQHMNALLERDAITPNEELRKVATIGLHHEQQHQELMITDVKHVLCRNPLNPVYREAPAAREAAPHVALDWISRDEGLREIGYEGEEFHYDNEAPRHKQYVAAFAMASRLVTNREYLAFMEDGGYERSEHWLSEGWTTVNEEGWQAPLYWRQQDGEWHTATLNGFKPLDLDGPVCHVSYFEADAYARWAGFRLPTEAEWEIVAREQHIHGNFVESRRFHPASAQENANGISQIYGDVWEWTQSPYTPYPGYRPGPGALGEYNGKFMCNQMVLRGGSCATSITHIRPTYRNFFAPESRWQFSGIRLAKDL